MARQAIGATNDYIEENEFRTNPITGFDVTCVIGRVEFSETGTQNPRVVAFAMIAEHDAEGTYSFPMANGQTCVVSVNHDGKVG